MPSVSLPPQESHPRAQKVLVAVEAAAAALHIMTVPHMPPRGALGRGSRGSCCEQEQGCRGDLLPVRPALTG